MWNFLGETGLLKSEWAIFLRFLLKRTKFHGLINAWQQMKVSFFVHNYHVLGKYVHSVSCKYFTLDVLVGQFFYINHCMIGKHPHFLFLSWKMCFPYKHVVWCRYAEREHLWVWFPLEYKWQYWTIFLGQQFLAEVSMFSSPDIAKHCEISSNIG